MESHERGGEKEGEKARAHFIQPCRRSRPSCFTICSVALLPARFYCVIVAPALRLTPYLPRMCILLLQIYMDSKYVLAATSAIGEEIARQQLDPLYGGLFGCTPNVSDLRTTCTVEGSEGKAPWLYQFGSMSQAPVPLMRLAGMGLAPFLRPFASTCARGLDSNTFAVQKESDVSFKQSER